MTTQLYIIGNQIAPYWEHSGVWQSLATITDTSIPGPGYLALSTSGGTVEASVSSFGGGPASSAGASNFLVPYMGVIPATLGTTTVNIG